METDFLRIQGESAEDVNDKTCIGDQEMGIESLSSYDPENIAKSRKQVRSGPGTSGGIKVSPEVLEREKAEKAAEEAKLARMTEVERAAYQAAKEAKKRAEREAPGFIDPEDL